MKLIVGLGNPGIEYQFTPHNMGFLAVDRIAEQCGVRVSNRLCRALTGRAVIAEQDVLLAKPETYMNLSGMSVRELVRERPCGEEDSFAVFGDRVIVVADERFGRLLIEVAETRPLRFP